MEIIPAIYILNGQAVALYKGNFEQKEVYRRTPLEYAKQFADEGAKKLFLINLDSSEDLLKEIRNELQIELMCAGGIRTMDQVTEMINLGMDYIVLGVSAEEIYKESIDKYGDKKIIVGIKAKGNEVITDKEMKFPQKVIDLAETLPSYGVKTVLYKDLWKESTMIGPNYDEPDRILQMTGLEVYYSGGIGKEKNLKILKQIGVKGAIIGKALYEGILDLSDLMVMY